MSESFFIKNTTFDDFSNSLTLREANSFVIGPGELDGPGGRTRNSDLELYGFGSLKWGEGVNQNLFRMLENHACPAKETGDFLVGTDDPDGFVPGTGSFDTGIHPVTPKDDYDLGIGNGITVPIIGQQWFNITDEETYMYITSGWSLVTASTLSGGSSALAAHIADDTLHLTADQNTFLDGLNLPALTSTEVNYLIGVTSPVQTQLDSMVEKAGDNMTGDLNMDSSSDVIFSSGGQLLFESGDHRITNNDDSSGNFNIRVGNYFDSGKTLYSQNDVGAVHMVVSHALATSPNFQIKIGEDYPGVAFADQEVKFKGTTTFKNDGNVSVSALAPNVAEDLTRKDYVDAQLSDSVELMMDILYPVGSIYITTVNSVPPLLAANKTWVAESVGRTIIGAGGAWIAGSIGGETRTTLLLNQMPSHNHGGGSHYHNIASSTVANGGPNISESSYISHDGGPNSSNREYRFTTDAEAVAPNRGRTSTKSVISTQGNNATHNNMPPYLVMYIFKRTA